MMRLSLGLASLTVSLLFAAHAVGLLPDREAAELKGRKALCESLAVACSLAAERDDAPMIRNVIRSVVGRNPEILSAAARRADGDLLVTVGDHRRHWGDGRGDGLHADPHARADRPRRQALGVDRGPVPPADPVRRSLALLGGSLVPLVVFVGVGRDA